MIKNNCFREELGISVVKTSVFMLTNRSGDATIKSKYIASYVYFRQKNP